MSDYNYLKIESKVFYDTTKTTQTESDLKSSIKSLIETFNLQYEEPSKEERDNIILDIINALNTPLETAGKHKLEKWEKGWYENLELLKEVCAATSKPIVASGGVSKLQDLIALHELVEIGIEGAIVGKAIYSGNLDLVTALKEVSR